MACLIRPDCINIYYGNKMKNGARLVGGDYGFGGGPS